jgi:hypothetical protein
MSNLLDDHEFNLKTEKAKKEKPKTIIGVISFFIFLAMFGTQIVWGETSETALVKGSYIWMPFLVMSLLGFVLPPKKALLAGVLTVPVTFLFYILIWPAL